MFGRSPDDVVPLVDIVKVGDGEGKGYVEEDARRCASRMDEAVKRIERSCKCVGLRFAWKRRLSADVKF